MEQKRAKGFYQLREFVTWQVAYQVKVRAIEDGSSEAEAEADASRVDGDTMVDSDMFEQMASSTEFARLLFGLFDHSESEAGSSLSLDDWFSQLDGVVRNIGDGHCFDEFLRLAKSVAVLTIPGKVKEVNPGYFHQILVSNGISSHLWMALASASSSVSPATRSGSISRIEQEQGTATLGDERASMTVNQLMGQILQLTSPRNQTFISQEEMARLSNEFRKKAGKNGALVKDHFSKMLSSKNRYFAEQAFKIFDQNRDGEVSIDEYIETMKSILPQPGKNDLSGPLHFLFRIYDANDNGHLEEGDFFRVLKASMEENGMEFDSKVREEMTEALWEEFVTDDGATSLSFDSFKRMLLKHPDLAKGLASSITKSILPPRPPRKKSLGERVRAAWPSYLTLAYWRDKYQVGLFLVFFFGVNIALFVSRAFYFKDFCNLDESIPNPFYMLSRANGRCLLFNSAMILVLVLRFTITKLRESGFATILPLDNNIALHKICGTVIFVQAWFHTIMHLCNFGINVQPNPVKFVQLTSKYWEPSGENRPGWLNLHYQIPSGCSVSNDTEKCSSDDLDPDKGVDFCQICEDGKPWTYFDWIMTTRPGIFGLIPGIANPTGVYLIIILTIMFICSLPRIRRGGHFEVFYFTHLLYIVYWVLLILHAPEFWKWFIGPGIIFLVELTFRFLFILVGAGKTHIQAGVVLPSKVTHLIIRRPTNFIFSSGDWVFVKIPAIAMTEWHPFTISSAPEQKDVFTLHIRGVGEWTRKLYAYFDAEYQRQQNLKGNPRTHQSRIGLLRRSVTRTFVSARRMLRENISILPNVTDDTEDYPVSGPSVDNSSVYRYLRRRPTIVHYRHPGAPVEAEAHPSSLERGSGLQIKEKRADLPQPLKIYIDGPFGAPASNIFRAKHAVLIATGIGVTPFSSILQSIMHRYWDKKKLCPVCNHKWTDDLSNLDNLKKVDFIWINRDQKSFEWFVQLLSQLEIEQAEKGGAMERFLDMHMYISSALEKTDLRAVGLHMAMDLLYEKGKRDLVTGLRSRTKAGRPQWDKLFQEFKDQKKGPITVFYCGNPKLGDVLRGKCEKFGFKFRKEVF